MSLIEHVAGFDGEGEDALLKALDKAKVLVDERFDGPERDMAKTGLDTISGYAGPLAHLGVGGVVSVMAQVGFDRNEDAQATFLTLSFEERREASHASTDETVRERLNRERSWNEVEAMLKDLGTLALKLIPLLLMAA